MRQLWSFFFILLLSSSLKAQDSVATYFRGAIDFLINTQIDSTLEGVSYAGEWPVYMTLTEPYFFIGRRQKAQDSNCFTVSAIHNFLAEIYLADSTLNRLKPVLNNSFQEVLTYGTGYEYNFWKKLPPLKNHKIGPLKPDLPLVHRPTNFSAKPRLIHKMSNVANDADDTNQANLAIWYHNKIFGENIPLADAEVFEAWIDQKRQNRNWFNYLFHSRKNSGAYMTWLAPEYRYGIWTPIHGYLSVLGVFLPTSSSYPKAYVPWIPWGANDICPVVNANVVNYLALSDNQSTAEHASDASRLITRFCKKEMWSTGGVYYPNALQLPYAVAKAYHNGVSELREAAEITLDYLEESQLENGAYVSRIWVNRGDTVQSTANALHALLDFKNAGLEVNQDRIDAAMRYLLSKAHHTEEGVHWDGGVYFTGGTALRNILHWESDAYTTALIAVCLQKYQQLKK